MESVENNFFKGVGKPIDSARAADAAGVRAYIIAASRKSNTSLNDLHHTLEFVAAQHAARLNY